MKTHQSKKVHSDKRIPSAPNVNQHNRERLAEKYKVDKFTDYLKLQLRKKGELLSVEQNRIARVTVKIYNHRFILNKFATI